MSATTFSLAAREPIKILADIIATEMGLDAGAVMLDYQKWNVPKTDGLYVNLRYLGPGRVVANVNECVPDGSGGLTEVQSCTLQHLIQIEMKSYDASARMRQAEMEMSLTSVYAQGLMELYSVQIARNPGPPVDDSRDEGSGWLTSYAYVVPVFSVQAKSKPAAYYDAFPTEYADDGSADFEHVDPAQTPSPPEA